MSERRNGRDRSQQLTVRISPDLLETLRALSGERGESISETVRRAVSAEALLHATDESESVHRRQIRDRLARHLVIEPRNFPFDFGDADASRPDGFTKVAASIAEESSALPAYERRMQDQLGLLGADGLPVHEGTAARARLLIDVRSVSERLVREAANDPSSMHTLSGHQFEELVAELLYHKGYVVSRVPPGPDGGVDIYAARQSEVGSFLYLVQCKRWNEHRPVGIDVVQRLYGRVESDKATAGLVVTTSRFTKPAIQYADQVQMRLGLRDFSDLIEWLSAWRATL